MKIYLIMFFVVAFCVALMVGLYTPAKAGAVYVASVCVVGAFASTTLKNSDQ